MSATADRDDPVREFWEEMYRGKPQVWSGEVNPWLAELAADLSPGRALDLGCGEGGDAIWMARQGWSVTAVDVAQVALTRAGEHAVAAGVGDRIDLVRLDLEAGLPEGPFDLISAQFLQSPVELARERILAAAARALSSGGVLIVVAHAAAPSWAPQARPATAFPSPTADLAALELPEVGWEVIRAEVVTRTVAAPDGQPGEMLDSLVVVRRDGDAAVPATH